MTTSKGFTLIELLIAMAVFSVLAAMGYGGLSNILTLQKRQAKVQAGQEDIQRALLIMSRDFYQLVPRPVRNNDGSFVNAVSYDSNNNVLEFTKSGSNNPIKFNQSSLQRIAYVLEADRLYRQHWSVLDRPLDAIPAKYALMQQVDSLTFKFLNNKGEWSKFWSPQKLMDLPKAIEMVIELTDGQVFLHTFPVLQSP